jgi:hypothetical protein
VIDWTDWRVAVAILAAVFFSGVALVLWLVRWVDVRLREARPHWFAGEIPRDGDRIARNDAAYVIAVGDPNPGVRRDALDYLDRRGGDRDPGYVRGFGHISAWTTTAARVDALQKAQRARHAHH